MKMISRRGALAAGLSVMGAFSAYALLRPQESAAGPDQTANLTALAEEPSLGERWLGKADARVTVVEFASATCPH